jgi:hypothetical protein
MPNAKIKKPGEDTGQRVQEAVEKVTLAGRFDLVIINPDANGDDPPALNEPARIVTDDFGDILLYGQSEYAEVWPSDILPTNPASVR